MSELKNGKLSVTVDVNLNLVNPDHKDIILKEVTKNQCLRKVDKYIDVYESISKDSYMHYSAHDIAEILKAVCVDISEV